MNGRSVGVKGDGIVYTSGPVSVLFLTSDKVTRLLFFIIPIVVDNVLPEVRS